MTHQMRLNADPFNKIKNKTKTVELRLNDEKRSKIRENDKIEFTNRETNEKLLVEVTGLYKYPNFRELYNHFSGVEMGYNENEFVDPNDMEEYYSIEEQEKYGVLGITIKVL